MDKRLLDNPTEMVCESSILYGREKRLIFEDIIAGNASHYSGQVDNIPTFITRKRGDEAIAYDYTNLDPMYGTIVYGEPSMWKKIPRKILRIKLNPQQIYWKPVLQVEIDPEIDASEDRADGIVQLVQSWMEEDDTDEQKETLEYLIRALDEDRLSNRKLFPKELKGKSW